MLTSVPFVHWPPTSLGRQRKKRLLISGEDTVREGEMKAGGEKGEGVTVRDVDYVFKIVVVGDAAVGKTQVLARFAKGEFTFDSKSTIGVEFQTRTLVIDGKCIKAQIWDTAGQERYRAVTSAYYRGALGAMIVYDITKRQSFDHVARWVEELRAHADTSIIVMLVGNKADLAGQRAVATEHAVEFAEEQGLFFSETSALSGENVEIAFQRLLEEIYVAIKRKSLECEAKNDLLMLRGTKLALLTDGTMTEISAMKKAPPCSCL